MSLQNSRYDSGLKMFVEPSRNLDLPDLRFFRWLGERGVLAHALAGAPCPDELMK